MEDTQLHRIEGWGDTHRSRERQTSGIPRAKQMHTRIHILNTCFTRVKAKLHGLHTQYINRGTCICKSMHIGTETLSSAARRERSSVGCALAERACDVWPRRENAHITPHKSSHTSYTCAAVHTPHFGHMYTRRRMFRARGPLPWREAAGCAHIAACPSFPRALTLPRPSLSLVSLRVKLHLINASSIKKFVRSQAQRDSDLSIYTRHGEERPPWPSSLFQFSLGVGLFPLPRFATWYLFVSPRANRGGTLPPPLRSSDSTAHRPPFPPSPSSRTSNAPSNS